MKREYTKKNTKYWESLTKKNESERQEWSPLMASESYIDISTSLNLSMGSSVVNDSSYRRNKAGTSRPADSLKNIRDFREIYNTSRSSNDISVDIKDVVELCEKTYANVAIFRNTIDILTEFSNAGIYLTGGDSGSKKFIKEWFKRVDLESFCEQYFREYYRSGNIFAYKIEGDIDSLELKKTNNSAQPKKIKTKIPLKYTIIDPKEVLLRGHSSIGSFAYEKILSKFELEKIRLKKTPEDAELFNSLPEEVRKRVEKGQYANEGITVALDKKNVITNFYKKQDYEPFAVPFGFPVLDDIDFKIELKKIDKAISRTIQQAVLLVTMGDTDKEGNQRISAKAMEKIKLLLQEETVGRTIISDYSTKMQFIVPNVGDILNPEKYNIVNEDIREGLLNILTSSGSGGEKFNNQEMKVKVFLERLKEGRKVFINKFLQPEIKNICRALGFKKCPSANFQEIDLQDDSQVNRIWLRLLELGILTPEQTFEAFKTGVLPESEELKTSQKQYIKERKEDGYYVPLVGGASMKEDESTTNKDKTKEENIGGPNPNSFENGRPIGAKKENKDAFGLKLIKGNLVDVSSIINIIEDKIKVKNKLKELDESNKVLAFDIVTKIISNNEKEKWNNIASSISNNFEEFLSDFSINKINNEVNEIASKYDLDDFQASILYHSKCKV